MEKINFGIIKNSIFNKIENNFINENSLDKSKKLSNKFFEIINESPILHKQYTVYNNLENASINNDFLITKFINENMSIFKIYEQKDILNENVKLKDFVDEDIIFIDEEKKDLYEAIDNLIITNTNNNDDNYIHINKIHESFSKIYDHIKNNKKENLPENKNLNKFDDNVINIAINKFNERYSSLNEEDKKILKILSTETENNKKQYFESLKKETLNLLENLNENNIENKIDEASNKINSMNYNSSSIIKDTISLYELKKNLIPKMH